MLRIGTDRGLVIIESKDGTLSAAVVQYTEDGNTIYGEFEDSVYLAPGDICHLSVTLTMELE